ncbi:MAG: hypothetical protein J6Z49_10655 [Kiritimatiellae bacterium]|nr:hypothetical protein [Kiritimatiellia bacterium]
MTSRRMFLKGVGIFAAALTAFTGCVGPSSEKTVGAVVEKPLRVAVFVDRGARNIGVFRWLEITTRMKDAVATPVDGEAVRAGALDAMDVLVMPGGSSVTEAKSLGAEGREKLKDFIRRGGGYIGTCAGCCLLMEPAKHHPDMLNLIPFKFGPSGGKADMSIAFNERAQALAGIKKGTASIRFSEGPVLLPSKPVEDASIEVVATYDSDLNSMSEKERPSRAGCAAAVAGTYGKGRLFVLAVHPEHDVDDHYILQGAFRYVTGRELSWDYPQRRRGQLVVGFMCDDSFGVETAKLIQRLVTDGEFDVVPLNKKEVGSGGLRNVDAVLVPGGIGAAMLKESLGGDNAGRAKEFVARGGRVFAWGYAAEAAAKLDLSVTCVADGEAARAALCAFAAEPVPAPAPFTTKVAKPIRAGIYQDPNNSNIIIARMLAFAPEYELKFLSPADYVNGGLDAIDLIIQPGGGCTSQYKALGEKGAEALKRFVLNGGKYYGVCAGAFMALQQSLPNRPRIGLAPFKGDDPAHYRGSAPIKVKFTEEGQKALEGIGKTRTVVYAGGPALVPGEPVADSDIKILGSYAGRKISTTSGKPVEDMLGKGAFAGGRAGKGKVFISCPHPEFEETNHDIVRSGIKYLTGVAPSPAYLNRTRGALAIRYRSSDKASAEFLFGTLLRDRRFHVWPGKNGGDLPHLDAVVLTDKTNANEAKTMNAYIARGGRVVAVCDTPEKRKAAELLKGAVVVESYDDLIAALLK